MLLFPKTYKSYSFWSILLIALSVLYYDFNVQLYKKADRVIQWDIISYYAYLPASFIYKDLSLKFQENDLSEHNYVFWGEKQDNGSYQIKTTMGLSLLYAPFFAIAHLYANVLNIDSGGYSWPYKLALLFAALFYLIIGLWYLRKILLLFFEDKIVALTLFSIVWGTNLYFYSSNEGPMPHVFDFSLIIVFFYYTIKWHQAPSFKFSLILGVLSGIISLIRPINILVAFLFVFYNFEWKLSLKLFWQKRRLLYVILTTAALVWIPQFIYWKEISGHYLSYSYGDEGFFWFSPQFGDVLFSWRKGLFIYSPILLFSVWGYVLLYQQNKTVFWALFPFSVLYLYTVSSWWVWWYGGSFGMRALIDIFGVIAIPLAFSIKQMFTFKRLKKQLLLFLFFITLSMGIFHTAKYHYGSIHWDSMTKEALLKNYFQLKRKAHFENWIKEPNYEDAKKGRR